VRIKEYFGGMSAHIGGFGGYGGISGYGCMSVMRAPSMSGFGAMGAMRAPLYLGIVRAGPGFGPGLTKPDTKNLGPGQARHDRRA
jgi:hypothetical protein